MARRQARPLATQQVTLEPVQTTCRACGNRMRMARHSQRTVTTLQGVTHLTIKVYRCRNTTCPRFHQATRPEEEGRWAVPHGELGLDVIALVGTLRYQEQRSIPQIHQELQRRGVQIASRQRERLRKTFKSRSKELYQELWAYQRTDGASKG